MCSGGATRPVLPCALPLAAMRPSTFTSMFSLFRQRGPRGFDLPTRYYDAEQERRAERRQRMDGAPVVDRETLRARMRHGWGRQRADHGRTMRLVAMMVASVVALYLIMKRYLPAEGWGI